MFEWYFSNAKIKACKQSIVNVINENRSNKMMSMDAYIFDIKWQWYTRFYSNEKTNTLRKTIMLDWNIWSNDSKRKEYNSIKTAFFVFAEPKRASASRRRVTRIVTQKKTYLDEKKNEEWICVIEYGCHTINSAHKSLGIRLNTYLYVVFPWTSRLFLPIVLFYFLNIYPIFEVNGIMSVLNQCSFQR